MLPTLEIGTVIAYDGSTKNGMVAVQDKFEEETDEKIFFHLDNFRQPQIVEGEIEFVVCPLPPGTILVVGSRIIFERVSPKRVGRWTYLKGYRTAQSEIEGLHELRVRRVEHPLDEPYEPISKEVIWRGSLKELCQNFPLGQIRDGQRDPIGWTIHPSSKTLITHVIEQRAQNSTEWHPAVDPRKLQ